MYAKQVNTFCRDQNIRHPRDLGRAAVYRVHIGSNIAACSCGWSARRRTLKAMACQDAWTHSAGSGCDLNVPLVIPVRRNACLP